MIKNFTALFRKESEKVKIGDKLFDEIDYFGNFATKDRFLKARIGKKWGIITPEGKTIHSFEYELIGTFFDKGARENLCPVKKDNKYGCLNTDMEIIIPIEYDYITFRGWTVYVHNGLIFVMKKKKLYKMLTRSLQNELYRAIIFFEDLISLKEDYDKGEYKECWGIINEKGENVVDLKYDSIQKFDSGFARVEVNGFWGLIDENANEVVPCLYRRIASSFSEDLIVVGKGTVNGKNSSIVYGFLNKHGEEVIPCQYSYASSFKEGKAMISKSSLNGYVNKQGKEFW